MFKCIKVLAGVFFLAALVQFGCFVWVTTHKVSLHKADLIVVFPGDQKRIDAGYALVKEGYATDLAVVSYNPAQITSMAKKHQDSTKVKLITGGSGRSTFEDVYNATQIISQHKYHSIILVTSTYHMPRALFLLKTFLLSSGLKVDVQYSPVKMAADKSASKVMQLCYNEMVKLWGSTIELLRFQLTDTLLMDSPRSFQVKQYVKKRLLFSI
jgi:uncharacterized SAM-binding protein YcdF (DUF218 family)